MSAPKPAVAWAWYPGYRSEDMEWGNWRLVWGQRALFCKRVLSITQQNDWAFLVSVINANHAPAVVPQASPLYSGRRVPGTLSSRRDSRAYTAQHI